jgi:hypothetical protein
MFSFLIIISYSRPTDRPGTDRWTPPKVRVDDAQTCSVDRRHDDYLLWRIALLQGSVEPVRMEYFRIHFWGKMESLRNEKLQKESF